MTTSKPSAGTPISPAATREDLIAMIHHRDALVSALKETLATHSAPAGADAMQESHGSDKEAGWRLDFKWLVQLQTAIEAATGYGATLEVIEETILRTALRQDAQAQA